MNSRPTPKPRHRRIAGRTTRTPAATRTAAARSRATRANPAVEMSAALDRIAHEIRVQQAEMTADLTLRLLHTDREVREMVVDDERGSVLMTIGEIRVRAAVEAPEQFHDAASVVAIGKLRLAAAAPMGSDRLMLGFRANGEALLTVVETIVELPA